MDSIIEAMGGDDVEILAEELDSRELPERDILSLARLCCLYNYTNAVDYLLERLDPKVWRRVLYMSISGGKSLDLFIMINNKLKWHLDNVVGEDGMDEFFDAGNSYWRVIGRCLEECTVFGCTDIVEYIFEMDGEPDIAHAMSFMFENCATMNHHETLKLLIKHYLPDDTPSDDVRLVLEDALEMCNEDGCRQLIENRMAMGSSGEGEGEGE